MGLNDRTVSTTGAVMALLSLATPMKAQQATPDSIPQDSTPRPEHTIDDIVVNAEAEDVDDRITESFSSGDAFQQVLYRDASSHTLLPGESKTSFQDIPLANTKFYNDLRMLLKDKVSMGLRSTWPSNHLSVEPEEPDASHPALDRPVIITSDLDEGLHVHAEPRRTSASFGRKTESYKVGVNMDYLFTPDFIGNGATGAFGDGFRGLAIGGVQDSTWSLDVHVGHSDITADLSKAFDMKKYLEETSQEFVVASFDKDVRGFTLENDFSFQSGDVTSEMKYDDSREWLKQSLDFVTNNTRLDYGRGDVGLVVSHLYKELGDDVKSFSDVELFADHTQSLPLDFLVRGNASLHFVDGEEDLSVYGSVSKMLGDFTLKLSAADLYDPFLDDRLGGSLKFQNHEDVSSQRVSYVKPGVVLNLGDHKVEGFVKSLNGNLPRFYQGAEVDGESFHLTYKGLSDNAFWSGSFAYRDMKMTWKGERKPVPGLSEVTLKATGGFEHEGYKVGVQGVYRLEPHFPESRDNLVSLDEHFILSGYGSKDFGPLEVKASLVNAARALGQRNIIAVQEESKMDYPIVASATLSLDM